MADLTSGAGASPAMRSNLSAFQIDMRGKRVCFWGAPVDSVVAGGSLLDQLAASGANTGNMFIGYGLFNNTIAEHKSFHPGFHQLPADRFDEQYDALFIPASNFINPSSDFQAQYDYFSKVKAPIFCFGLGSQILPDQDIILKPGTEKLIRLIAERSGSVGVRGTFTAEILWRMGLRNITITGCPSLLGFSEAPLQRLLETRPTTEKLAVNFSNNVRRHSIDTNSFAATENALFQRATELNSFYIIQNETPELELMEAVKFNDTVHVEKMLARIRNAFGCYQNNDRFDEYLKWKTRVFFSVEPWITCLASMTASIGSRFHGNIAALHAGTPALYLVHDMRTLELCELLRVPHLVLDRPYSADELMEQLMGCDYSHFGRQIVRLHTEWKLFVGRNGMDVIGNDRAEAA